MLVVGQFNAMDITIVENVWYLQLWKMEEKEADNLSMLNYPCPRLFVRPLACPDLPPPRQGNILVYLSIFEVFLKKIQRIFLVCPVCARRIGQDRLLAHPPAMPTR
jgi:hypothetical protein